MSVSCHKPIPEYCHATKNRKTRSPPPGKPLRPEKRTLDVAMNMLSTGAQDGFSHESIAQAAGMGARTVYRHFPDRAELPHVSGSGYATPPIQSFPPGKKMSFPSLDRLFMHSMNMNHRCELFSVPRRGPKCGNVAAWKGDARLRTV